MPIHPRIGNPPPTPRAPTRWLPLLVIAIILILLAGLLWPAFTMIRSQSTRDLCTDRKRRVVLAALMYANDNDQLWPARPTDATGDPTTAKPDPYATAAASLELLCLRATDLPLQCFACTDHPDHLPPPPTPGLTATTGRSAWAASAATGNRLDLCYDWAAPADASAVRAVVADRAPHAYPNHNSGVPVAAADGHVLWIHLSSFPPTGPRITQTRDGGPEPTAALDEDTSVTTGDDIYDATGDGGDPDTPNRGSTTRAWVR